MKMKLNLITLFTLLVLTVTFTSCGEDPIRGCTDPEAENYDALAVEESGACVYARDKFIGNYVGSLACPGNLSPLSSDDASFTISEGLTDNVSLVVVQLTDQLISVNGTINGDNIQLNANIPEFPYDADGNGMPDINADIVISGGAVLTDGTLMGQMNISVSASSSGFELANDTCTLTGVKQ